MRRKSQLKITYEPAFGQYMVKGESGRTDTKEGILFYDRVAAISFKYITDQQDSYKFNL